MGSINYCVVELSDPLEVGLRQSTLVAKTNQFSIKKVSAKKHEFDAFVEKKFGIFPKRRKFQIFCPEVEVGSSSHFCRHYSFEGLDSWPFS